VRSLTTSLDHLLDKVQLSTTIAYPLPGTEFYEQVRDRLMFEGGQMPDWVHTAENRLLFQRGRYNTLFYRWVIRWFHREWEDARMRTGIHVSTLERLKGWAGLWLFRVVVRLLARLPGVTKTAFRPAEGA
jgi:hypothetical protein